MMGAVHRLVLEGRLPALAAVYSSTSGAPDRERARSAFLEALERCGEEIRAQLDRPVQTNEVWRSAALLGGFLLVAAETGLALRLLEVGASAGLNLRFDRYLYSAGDSSWGDPASAVRFAEVFAGEATPPLEVELEVAERLGCDGQPLDPGSREDRLTLVSYVWPDQTARLERLRRALELAATVPVPIERADGIEWSARMLADRRPGTAAVLFHSIVMQYLHPTAAERFRAVIEDAGERATPSAPFAWLRMEPGADMADVRLNVWPGGEERLLATCGYQSGPVTWRR
jgi:hypothetical protein